MVQLSPATPSRDLQRAWQEGVRALNEARPAAALQHLQAIVRAGQASPAVWLACALAHRRLDQGPEELAALEQALRLDPHDLQALLMVADHHALRGREVAASAYYDAVVKLAATGPVDPALRSDVARAAQARDRYQDAYETHLRAALAPGGYDRPEARRVRRAVELLAGKSEVYLQQPKGFYFPELPNIGYADRAQFPWMDRVEAAADEIRAELMRVLEEDGAFSPYVEAVADRPSLDAHGMLGNPDWSAFYLWKGGEPVPENIARCPATMAALEGAPLCHAPGRTPSILFSLLRPGAHIKPHHGFTNARYICHLPLVVPDGCAMRVGAETRAWTEGQACLFDDSIEHEAWNRHPDRLRVVLIFDVWRPELSALERELVATLLQAADSYGDSSGSPAPRPRAR